MTRVTRETRNTAAASLIENLRQARCYPHHVENIQLIETHISWVLLTGEYVYKIKKPLDLEFLDFSTLRRRHVCCEDELRLNRRLAPQIYLDVVAITGSVTAPTIAGHGDAIEYAVKMRQFPQDALASALLAAGKLRPQHLEALATTVSEFHRTAPATDAGSAFGTPQAIRNAAVQNFDQLQPLLVKPDECASIAELRAWTMREHEAQQNLMEQRRVAGAVRECHGDLHLGNIALLDDRLVAFDCLEFNPQLRWNDVLSEVAFLVMDLHDRGSPHLAWLFLNEYLGISGDYAGIPLLPFYLVYRAMVRAKVHALRANQPGLDQSRRDALLHATSTYLALAQKFAQHRRPALIITHGFSASGKSRVAGALMQQHGAIRLRSDVERKRLQGRAPLERGADGIAEGLYNDEATRSLYTHLADLAAKVVKTGFNVIVDAAFLKHWQRDLLRNVAREAGIPFLIVSITAPASVLRARIIRRQAANDDPSDASTTVLEHQLQTSDALTATECDVAVEVSSDDQDSGSHYQKVMEAILKIQ